MGRYLWVVVVGLLFAWPATARATTGGDHVIDVLGYAPGDHKIYFLLEHHDEREGPAELFFMKTEGRHAGRVFAVKSWYRDFEDPSVDDPRARFAKKLSRLRSRLVAMDEPTPTFSAAATVVASRPNPDAELWADTWETEYELEIAVFPIDDATHQITAGPVTAYEPGVEVAGEYRAPGTDVGLVVVRYFSDPWEYGYDTDVAVPVVYEP